ncbi:MAG: GNAT family N-acetyltransferase [Rhodococcus sp. (in: high G+C Gram-positive bacteria)]|uniref:GNAT family N-acetyltransferase n=1 Tax=Rhodococcus sp. TaxID=1831 RepID=UPI003BB76D8B
MPPDDRVPPRTSNDGAAADLSALADPVRASLDGHHAHLARHLGRAATYRADVSTFAAMPARPERADWSDLAALLGSGALADLFSNPAQPPPNWDPIFSLDGLQMVAPASVTDAAVPQAGLTATTELVELGADDHPDMLDLVARTRPGPFQPRTPEFGTYLGIRHRGTLIAMAGERLHPPGWTEISAVCTAPEARGHGHAGRLVRSLTARIAARGERAFLHVAGSNTNAIGLYTRLGFRPHRRVSFRGFRVP